MELSLNEKSFNLLKKSLNNKFVITKSSLSKRLVMEIEVKSLEVNQIILENILK